MNIILFGFKNCGKGFYGRALAKELNWPLVDIDDIIESIHFERAGERIHYRRIARRHGMETFRQLEKDAVERVSKMDGKVIATGGGTPLFFDNADKLKKLGKMVLLEVDKGTLFKRIMSRERPAFFDPEKPKSSFEKFYRERMDKFREIADFKVNCDHKSGGQVAREIISLLGID